jgi:NAD(P)-dependent dehydrogenase (short-subunit alcohol dehydrogenase family)
MHKVEYITGRRLAGRVAIVTGASQGLGASFALALAKAGAQVVVCDVADITVSCDAVRQCGAEAFGMRADVTDATSITRLVDEAIRVFGRVDILVNNAASSGQLGLKPIEEISSDEWDRVMAVNARGTFECIKAVLPSMRRNGYGKIINIASGTAIKGSPLLLHYVASKGAVIAITRATARELGGDGIRVNCIAPGLTMSESVRVHPDWNSNIRAANVATRAIPREAHPEDLLGALIFLASSESDFITGQTMSVDGGSVMN